MSIKYKALDGSQTIDLGFYIRGETGRWQNCENPTIEETSTGCRTNLMLDLNDNEKFN